MEVQVKASYPFTAIARRHPQLAFLADHAPSWWNDTFRWNRGVGKSYDIQVLFTGKTGYGKSSLINNIVGADVLAADDVDSCTQILQSVDYKLPSPLADTFFSFGDVPGVGENQDIDRRHLRSWESFASKAAVVTHVLRADQRDFSLDLTALANLRQSMPKASALIVALNFADKVEPVNRRSPFIPSPEQEKNIRAKTARIAEIFDIGEADICPVSASDGYGVDCLMAVIGRKLQRQMPPLFGLFTSQIIPLLEDLPRQAG